VTTTKRPYSRAFTIICPDCQGKLLIRTSEQVTDTVRELLLWCDNDTCGARFKGQISLLSRIERTVPTAAAVILPTGPWLPKRSDNDNRTPANDGPPVDLPPAAVAAAEPPMTG
jgi:hypothetical protein